MTEIQAQQLYIAETDSICLSQTNHESMIRLIYGVSVLFQFLNFRLPDMERNKLIPSDCEIWNFVDHAQVGSGKDGMRFVKFVNEPFERTVGTIAAETE